MKVPILYHLFNSLYIGYFTWFSVTIILLNHYPLSKIKFFSFFESGYVASPYGSPVFLTKNGRGKYAIVDILDYEKAKATIQLVNELAKGKQSGEEKGWLSADEVKAHLKERYNAE